MRIVFFGTAEFAVGALKALANSRHDVCCVVTQPQRKKGRGLKLAKSPVEEFALERSIEVLELDDVNSKQAIKELKDKNVDLFVVAAFGQIMKRETLDIPKQYSINIHASILPKCRGASPIQRAILNGDKKTGVSIIIMNEFLDKGDIISIKEVKIKPDDDAIKLSARLSKCAAELVLRAIDKIDTGNIKPVLQDESQATYAPKLVKEDGLINWNAAAGDIINKIRACKPWPSAYTYFDKKLLKILEAEKILAPSKAKASPGEVISSSKDELLIACKDSGIRIKALQLEGKRPLNIDEFLRGHNMECGVKLG
jgi:methionyl-tRNA formyltransferase